jgi:integrase
MKPRTAPGSAAEWNEFDLDSAEPQWRIPVEKMKMRAQHIVALSIQALALVRELQSLPGRGRYVFPSLRSGSRPMSENALNGALRRLGYSTDETTGHGFRSLASTCLNEQGCQPDLIELQSRMPSVIKCERPTTRRSASLNAAR